jgi:hypothetical protein
MMVVLVITPVTLNVFQGHTFPAPFKIKMLKQVQHDGMWLKI